ncbi:hypothetical protein T01_5360 [Trichinella spiralis]|uniref:Uncharacterized protein n=1 Tax=Trichinella spiralis TaxID=6334 RepID=A0A0V1AGX5_TRISP|nr:hypothetical protein T01_5360 [Trichinella spiralis]
MNSTNEAEKRLKLLQVHYAVDIALFDVSIFQCLAFEGY